LRLPLAAAERAFSIGKALQFLQPDTQHTVLRLAGYEWNSTSTIIYGFNLTAPATYDVSGTVVQVFGPSGDWLAVTAGSRLDNMMNFACDGTVPDGVTPINSNINSLAARFREIRAGA
jgi:hypothetical protein